MVTARYLLDTNILSEPLRPRPDPKILHNLQLHQGELSIAATVWHELWYGCQRLEPSARRAAIEKYLSEVVGISMPVIPYDAEAAAWHAAERARLARIGKTPAFADGQIAAIAHVRHLTLVTLNTVDYAAFASIQIENWSR